MSKTGVEALKSRTLSVSIAARPEVVYAFAADPLNMPKWAAGLCRSIGKIDGSWIIETADGAMTVEFAPRNPFGVLDHTVTLATGLKIFAPMRVIQNGDGAEVLFTLFQLPGMSDAKFVDDAGLVQQDLATLKRIIEER